MVHDSPELKNLHLVSGIRLLCKPLGIRQVVGGFYITRLL